MSMPIVPAIELDAMEPYPSGGERDDACIHKRYVIYGSLPVHVPDQKFGSLATLPRLSSHHPGKAMPNSIPTAASLTRTQRRGFAFTHICLAQPCGV
jgi:hypothetical protein